MRLSLCALLSCAIAFVIASGAKKSTGDDLLSKSDSSGGTVESDTQAKVVKKTKAKSGVRRGRRKQSGGAKLALAKPKRGTSVSDSTGDSSEDSNDSLSQYLLDHVSEDTLGFMSMEGLHVAPAHQSKHRAGSTFVPQKSSGKSAGHLSGHQQRDAGLTSDGGALKEGKAKWIHMGAGPVYGDHTTELTGKSPPLGGKSKRPEVAHRLPRPFPNMSGKDDDRTMRMRVAEVHGEALQGALHDVSQCEFLESGKFAGNRCTTPPPKSAANAVHFTPKRNELPAEENESSHLDDDRAYVEGRTLPTGEVHVVGHKKKGGRSTGAVEKVSRFEISPQGSVAKVTKVSRRSGQAVGRSGSQMLSSLLRSSLTTGGRAQSTAGLLGMRSSNGLLLPAMMKRSPLHVDRQLHPPMSSAESLFAQDVRSEMSVSPPKLVRDASWTDARRGIKTLNDAMMRNGLDAAEAERMLEDLLESTGDLGAHAVARVLRRAKGSLLLVLCEYAMDMLGDAEARVVIAAHGSGTAGLWEHFHGVLGALQPPKAVPLGPVGGPFSELVGAVFAQWTGVRMILHEGYEDAPGGADAAFSGANEALVRTVGGMGVPLALQCLHPAARMRKQCVELRRDVDLLRAEIVAPADMFQVALATKRLQFPCQRTIQLLLCIGVARPADDAAYAALLPEPEGAAVRGSAFDVAASMRSSRLMAALHRHLAAFKRERGVLSQSTDDAREDSTEVPAVDGVRLERDDSEDSVVFEDSVEESNEESALDDWSDREEKTKERYKSGETWTSSGSRKSGRDERDAAETDDDSAELSLEDFQLWLAEHYPGTESVEDASYELYVRDAAPLAVNSLRTDPPSLVADLAVLRSLFRAEEDARLGMGASPGDFRPPAAALVTDARLVDHIVEMHIHHLQRLRDAEFTAEKLTAAEVEWVRAHITALAVRMPHHITPDELDALIHEARGRAGTREEVPYVVATLERMRGSVVLVHELRAFLERAGRGHASLTPLGRMTLATLSAVAFVTGTAPMGRSVPINESPFSLNHLRKIKDVGSGTYGAVSVARTSADALVAVKTVAATGESHVKHAIDEVRILSQLAHPGVVPLLAVYIAADKMNVWAVERFIDGPSCDDLMRGGYFSLAYHDATVVNRRLAFFFRRTLEALRYLHAPVHGENHDKRVIHRDIKPANIVARTNLAVSYLTLSRPQINAIMRESPEDFVVDYVFVDFNFSDVVAENSEHHSGTSLYTSIEVIDRRPNGPPSDLQSLSLTGKALIQGERLYENRRRAFRSDIASILPHATNFMRRVWQDNPADRATIEELLLDLFLQNY